jgi:hypothetical protein
MATVRLIVVLLVLGAVVLLGAQNLATALPLVVLGGRTQSLPLGVWLVGAILLGALTTLALVALLSRARGGGGRSAAYKYRPQPFYEPAPPSAEGDPQDPGRRRSTYGAVDPGPADPRQAAAAAAAAADPTWQDWTNLQSPGRWNDWETLSQSAAPDPRPAFGDPGPVQTVMHWFSSSKRQAYQQQRVSESLRELDDDWGDLDRRAYRVPGASPVDDSLNDIAQGWGATDVPSPDPWPGEDTAPTPRRVYRDGSLYSYGYRDDAPGAAPGQVDNIYGPADDSRYGDALVSAYGGNYPLQSDYVTDAPRDEFEGDALDGDESPLGDPEVAEDGVVDADYRVIVPPYPTGVEAATSTSWADQGPAAGASSDGDEWDAADDALTP